MEKSVRLLLWSAAAMMVAAGAVSRASAQADSCLFAFDGECDQSPICAPGTDTADCSAESDLLDSDLLEGCVGASDDECAPDAMTQTPDQVEQADEPKPPAAPAQSASAPAPTGGEPSGLYLMQIYWIGTRSLEHDAYLFQDGQVATSPEGDIADFDFAAARAASPSSVGAYEVRGDAMAVTWGDGQTQESVMEWSDSCFFWDARSFCPALPFAAAALDGAYSGGISVSTSFGTAMNEHTYVFGLDGSYRLESAGSLTTETEDTGPDESVVSGGSTGGEAGRYRIDGLTLSLFPDDGEHRSMTAFPFSHEGGAATPESIFLGGRILQRQP